MSIDIEGMEYDILSSFDMLNKGPKILTVEIMKNDAEKRKQMEQLLKVADHVLWLKSGTNYTFVKQNLVGGE